MNRVDFGNLVQALRLEHLDEFGIPWTQERLAVEANISLNVVRNIECGRKKNPDPSILIDLANALNLTSGERKEFFAAVSGIDHIHISNERTNPLTVQAEMFALLRRSQIPAFVMDSFGELLAINAAVLVSYGVDMSIYEDESVNPYTRYSLMRLIYAPEFEEQRRLMGSEWEPFSYTVIMLFRTLTFPFRAHPHFRKILPALNRYPLFKKCWQTAHLYEYDEFMDNGVMTVNHPVVGRLQWVGSSLIAVTGFGDLRLYSFLPLTPGTLDFVSSIIGHVGEQIYTLATWPKQAHSATLTV